MQIQQRKSPLVCESNIDINIMNIVHNLRASRNNGSMCMKKGSRCYINAAEISPMLACLVRILGRVSIVEFNRQNRIKMQKNRGSLS
jgi:hypothetical protein